MDLRLYCNLRLFPFRFIEVPFSKNPEKYIKYRPEDLSSLLSSLFDDTV